MVSNDALAALLYSMAADLQAVALDVQIGKYPDSPAIGDKLDELGKQYEEKFQTLIKEN